MGPEKEKIETQNIADGSLSHQFKFLTSFLMWEGFVCRGASLLMELRTLRLGVGREGSPEKKWGKAIFCREKGN